MREMSVAEIHSVSGGLCPDGDAYYNIGEAVGRAYAWAVDKTSRAIEWVADYI